MKDRQINSSGTPQSIPVVSPVLHWLAMPAILTMRSSFGFAFLGPKSVFLAFSWASFLFLIYAWVQRGAWASYWALALFCAATSVLYVLHLAVAFTRETQQKGKHDFYSGTSHLLRVPGFSQNKGNASFETVLHLWIEPACVFVLATALRGFLGETMLSAFLLFVAAGLWLKEFINYWYGLRSEKKHEDIIEDAEEKMPGGGSNTNAPLPTAAGRKSRVKRSVASEVQTDESRFAELLRLMPPYSLGQAEANYRALMKMHHPDPNNASTDGAAKAAELNDAIEHFRRSLSN